MPSTNEPEYNNKDFTDYVMLFLNTGRATEFESAFNKLVKDARKIEDVYPELFEEESSLTKELEDEEYKEINFYDATKEKYIGKPIKFKAIVRGEAEKPYLYPSKAKLTCEMQRGDTCNLCGLAIAGGNFELNLETVNPLELIDCALTIRNAIIKSKVGIRQCGQYKMELVNQKYLQELFLSPIVDDVNAIINPEADEKKEQRFIVRHAFSKGADIVPNKTYMFYGIPTALPKNQSLVFFISKAKEEEDNLDKFKLSEQDIEDLKIFQPFNDDYIEIESKLKDIYEDFSINLSPVIRFRNDLMFSCDLVFHSVLHFWFCGSYEKGWGECLLVGDTSTGKTQVTTKLIRHYRLGIIQGSENSTIAGLIGGMTKFESINIMTWGLLPLNNSRLVCLDEMSGIDKRVFGEMTRIRSEGIAERTIVGGSSSTSSKVRLIWLSNPRKRSMRLYDSGCDMIKELVGVEEDISRFDFIVTVSSDDVNVENINSMKSAGLGIRPAHKYTSDLCNKLLLWVWSRKANNITFESGVEELILDYSIKMAKRYTPNFPLVLGSTIRIKLAKLSIALAGRLFSIDKEHPENILVKENHVSYIYEFLNRIYNNPSFGYGEYSDFSKAGDEKSQSTKEGIFRDISMVTDDMKSFIINMLQNSRITALDIRDFIRCGKDRADEIRSKLVSSGLLIKKAGFYVKSDLFRKALKAKLKEVEEE